MSRHPDDIEDRSQLRCERDDQDDQDELRDDATDREAERQFELDCAEADFADARWGQSCDATDREAQRRFLADAQRHLLGGQRAEVTDDAVEGEDSLWNMQS